VEDRRHHHPEPELLLVNAVPELLRVPIGSWRRLRVVLNTSTRGWLRQGAKAASAAGTST
jgi:hypothetical protein